MPEVSYVMKRRTAIFSPIFCTSALRFASTFSPPKSSLESAARSAGFFIAMSSASPFANFWKSSFFATKSVSLFTSIRTPVLPSPVTLDAIMPSEATRADFFAAAESPFFLRMSTAFSKSPPASSRAFFASIMPTPVFSLRSFTALADIVAIALRTPFSVHNAPYKHCLNDILIDVGLRLLSGGLHGCGLGFSCGLRSLRGLTLLLGDSLSAFDDGIRHLGSHKPDCADGIVVARDDIIDVVGVAVRIDDGDHGDV